MNGHPFFRRKDMCAHEGVILPQVMGFTIDTDNIIGKTPAQGSVCEKVTYASFNIHPAVGLCGTGLVAEGIKSIQSGTQMQGQGLEHITPLVKSHLPESGITNSTSVVKDLFEIKSFCTGSCQRFTGHCIKKNLPVSVTGDPFPGYVVFQFCHKQTFSETKLPENAKNRGE